MKSLQQILAEQYRAVQLSTKDFDTLTESEQKFLVENRIEHLITKNPTISTEHDPYAEHKDAADIIRHFADKADPSPNKQHTQYIVGQYKKGNIRQEDASRVHQSLSDFMAHKPKLANKDLNSYKNFNEVDAAVSPHLGTATTKKEKEAEVEHAGHEKVYEDENITAHHLKTKEASQQLYGGGVSAGKTNWCTAAKSENCMFDHYSKNGPLVVIKRKSDGKLWQAHAHSNSFMDEHDTPIKDEDFESIKPSFHRLLNHRPDLFGADNL